MNGWVDQYSANGWLCIWQGCFKCIHDSFHLILLNILAWNLIFDATQPVCTFVRVWGTQWKCSNKGWVQFFCSNFGWPPHRELCSNWLKCTPVFRTHFAYMHMYVAQTSTHSTYACKYQSSSIWMRGATAAKAICRCLYSCNRLNCWI